MAQPKGKTEEITGSLDPKYWVQKSDPLVLMRSVPFNLGELKILDTYISRINAADDTRRTVIFTKEEYEELMELSNVDYRTLQKYTKGMLGKVVELEMPNKEYLQFVLFEQARYRKDEYGKPFIELTCTATAKDLFFCINKYHYFKYALENVIRLTRKSSYLLYLYIMANRFRAEWKIDLAELRDKVLDCKNQESYQAYKEFNRAVLAPAAKEVNEKTDCHFGYESIKRGRKITAIKFTYIQKDKDEEIDGQLSIDSVVIKNTTTYTEDDYDRRYDTLAFVCDFSFPEADIAALNELLLKLQEKGKIDKTGNIYSKELARCNYLKQKFTEFKRYEQKKASEGNPIKDRFAYIKKMLEKELG